MSVSKDLRRRKYSCTNFRLHQVIHSCRHDAHQKSWCCIICPATRMGSQELSGVGNKRLSNCTMWGRKGHLNLHCNKNAGVLRILFLQFTSTALNLLSLFHRTSSKHSEAHLLFFFVLSESQPLKNCKFKTWQVSVNRQNHQSNNTGEVAFRSSSLQGR